MAARVRRMCCGALFLIASTVAVDLFADDAGPAVAVRPLELTPATTFTVEELAAHARDSVVVISYRGRDGQRAGIGSGFIISSDGLIATNLHVIGEARPISVRLSDRREFDVETIYATERSVDLALVKIDAKNLPALPLGDSSALQQGQPVVALGNPLGFEHSVVAGIVSGRREIDGMPLIQLAIPIERGNSGGPLLDLSGHVHGLLTLKSLASENLGFAVEINALKPLLREPNPVPIKRWLTIGALDPGEWTSLFGANWRQRAGRISVDGQGQGFGGRSLNLSNRKLPELPFEVAVDVRMEEKDGAAGLAFHSDGDNRHYGFYPTNGRLRLSRFDGPDVYSWKVLAEVESRHYRPDDWNTIKVRLDPDRIACYVNDELVIESADDDLRSGRVGLVKFRHTTAEFKRFQVGKQLPDSRPPEVLVKEITALVDDLPTRRPAGEELVERLVSKGEPGIMVLEEHARELQRRAERLRQLGEMVNHRRVQQRMSSLLEQEPSDLDLLHAALLIAKLDNPELDVDAYLRQIDRMVSEVRQTVPGDADEQQTLKCLDAYLFDELGFHGSRGDYYNRSNSYINEVIDDREGLPITLSVLYMEMARRLGVRVVGIGLPGHFVVRHEPAGGEGELIDVFDRAKRLSRDQAVEKVQSITGNAWNDAFLAPASHREILLRMLRNLLGVARDENDPEAMLRYVEMLVMLDGASGEPRWFRAVLRFQTGRIAEALADTQWLLDRQPTDVPIPQVQQLQRVLEESSSREK